MVEPGISFTVTAKAYGYADSVSTTLTYLLKLDPVTNVTVADDVVSWTPVENATDYTVEITAGGLTFTIPTKECAVSLSTFENGPISINVSTYLGILSRRISIDLFRKKNREKRRASEYAWSLN